MQNTGKLEFSFAARIAAFASYKSEIVSIRIRSTPASAPARTWRLYKSYACSNFNDPRGSNNCPVGPKSRATYFFPAAFLARLTALWITSSTEY